MLERNSIGSGMLVRAADGSRLGRVYAAGKEFFWIRPRFKKTPTHSISLAAVKSLERGDVILKGGRELLTPIDSSLNPEPLTSVRPLSRDEQAAMYAP